MIRKILPSLLLLIAGWAFATICIGFLAAALAVWLSIYWGLTAALLAVAGFAALAAVIAFAVVYFRAKGAKSRLPAVEATAVGIWKSHPVAITAAATLTAFLLARKPGLVARVLTSTARSAAALATLKRLM